MLKAEEALRQQGLEVEIPWGVKKYRDNNFIHVSEGERAKDKKENDLIKRYYEHIKEYDAVLVVNADKKGIRYYIGGNTFLEMGFGYVLGKHLFVLNPLPDVSYRDEMEAMSPIILNGDLSLIK